MSRHSLNFGKIIFHLEWWHLVAETVKTSKNDNWKNWRYVLTSESHHLYWNHFLKKEIFNWRKILPANRYSSVSIVTKMGYNLNKQSVLFQMILKYLYIIKSFFYFFHNSILFVSIFGFDHDFFFEFLELFCGDLVRFVKDLFNWHHFWNIKL